MVFELIETFDWMMKGGGNENVCDRESWSKLKTCDTNITSKIPTRRRNKDRGKYSNCTLNHQNQAKSLTPSGLSRPVGRLRSAVKFRGCN